MRFDDALELEMKARGLLPGRFGRGKMRRKFNDRAMEHLQRAGSYADHARDAARGVGSRFNAYTSSPSASRAREMNAAAQMELQSSNRYARAANYLQSRRKRR